MSVNNRSNIWGLPQFETSLKPPVVPIVFDSKQDAKLKRNQSSHQAGRRVNKINIQLSETQQVVVDYRIENQAVSMPDPVKVRSRLKARLGLENKSKTKEPQTESKPQTKTKKTESKKSIKGHISLREINDLPARSSGQLIEITPKSIQKSSKLTMPDWSIDQIEVRFLGYIADDRNPQGGQLGDFYLTENGQVWLKTKIEWIKV